MSAENLRQSFGKCEFKEYKTTCNFPADGLITEETWTHKDVWSFEQVVTRKLIPACGYHIMLFVEQRDDED